MFEKYIDPVYFLISFAIGIFLTYVFTPPPKIVVKYPTPYNAGKITYKDDNNVCYRYKANKVKCPIDKSKIKLHSLNDD